MCLLNMIKIAIILLMAGAPNIYADPTPSTDISSSSQTTFLSRDDPFVKSLASFAADQMQRGKLYAIILAQQLSDTNYVLILDVVDAHVLHHHYQAQIYVPADNSPWQLVYFTPTNQ